jgi:cytochrome c oxidase subunit 3
MLAKQGTAYYVPHGSHWPIVGSVGLFSLMIGASSWLNEATFGKYLFLVGVAILVIMISGWFGTVIAESEGGAYNLRVDKSFRMGMSWFIFSEVMFFAVFFGALFYARTISVPWLGGAGNNFFTNLINWESFQAAWPTNGPANVGGDYQVMSPWGLPAINTLILLTSGATITVAHHAIKEGNRRLLNIFLFLTFSLGFLFVGLQAYEYYHAYHELNLTMGSGIYGSTFFMLTGFHGMHVTVGAIILTVIWFRTMKGHFLPEHHFGFEAAAWYWHFVDVVWLGLFIFVYWL